MDTEKIIEDVLKERLEKLNEMVDIQCSDGNWNYDPYMFGMANGMIFSVNIIENDLDNPYTGQKSKRPFLDAPSRWLAPKKEAIKIIAGLANNDFTKIAVSLGELIQNTSQRSKKYVKKCITKLFRSFPEKGLWIFKVKGAERWSKGINTVRFQLLGKGIKTKGILGRDISLSCTCNAWKFLGADYNALAGGYSERQFSDGRPPKIRDPKRKFKVCKHIAACVPIFKDITIPKEYK